MTTILVVDDEVGVRALLRDVLECEGYAVREAADGLSALAEMQTRRPDLVVLDIMMPGLSGIDVLTRIRADATLATLPVLLLSAAGDDATTWAGWTAGASSYLCKPYDYAELLRWIERLLTPVDDGARLMPARAI